MHIFQFCPRCGHKIKKVNKNGFLCDHCLLNYYFNSIPAVAVLPIYQDQLMISVRGINPGKGMYDVIGGFLNNGEDPKAAAIREFFEETGLRLSKSKLKFLGFWISEYIYSDDLIKVLNIVYTINFAKKVTPPGRDDVEKLVWLNINGKYKFAFKFSEDVIKNIKSSS